MKPTPAQKRALEKVRRKLIQRAFPPRIEVAYLRNLNALLREIDEDAVKSITATPGYTADAFSDYIGRIIEEFLDRWSGSRLKAFANRVARMFVTDSLTYAVEHFQMPNEESSFSVNGFNSPQLMTALRIAVDQNVQLIQSIARQHSDAIASMVFANIQAGMRPEAIEAVIRSYGVTKSRAKFIARDQTAKVMSTMSRIKQQDAGFRYFRWVTAKDSRVREEHRAISLRETPYGIGVYAWDDLPRIRGERMAPGMDFNCRCVATPVADYEVEEWRRKKSA